MRGKSVVVTVFAVLFFLLIPDRVFAAPPSQDPLEPLFAVLEPRMTRDRVRIELTQRNLKPYAEVYDYIRLGWQGDDILGEGNKPSAYIILDFNQTGLCRISYVWHYANSTSSRSKGSC